MRSIAIPALSLVLFGCQPQQTVSSSAGPPKSIVTSVSEAITPCPDEASIAVLHKLAPVLGYDTPTTIEGIERQEGRIKCIQEWSVSIADPCVRDNYGSWLKHYASKCKLARKEMSQKGAIEAEDAKFEREQREKARRVRDFERAHNVPDPPSCERELIRKVRPDPTPTHRVGG